jgi:peptidoglycan LD-endopeptidase CwlK
MPSFGHQSLTKLATCDQRLQDLFNEVVKTIDCTVLEGHRGQAAQTAVFVNGHSKNPWPTSKHNSYPSKAVDVAPYPVDWDDKGGFYIFAGFVKAIANKQGIKIRCGVDWDGDGQTRDQTFHDLPHFELVD